MSFKSESGKILFYLPAVLIVAFSAWYYAPCFYPQLNSDMAIHILMTKDFELPRDYYYWGQNRLGSLLPMIGHWIYSVVKINPVYICSIVHYAFLVVPVLLIVRLFKSIWLKLTFVVLIFFPFNSYNALLYIGHPYSQQLFTATLFLYFLSRVHKKLVHQENLNTRDYALVLMWLTLSCLFFVLGIWVSEFNAIVAMIPLIYVLFYWRQYRKVVNPKQFTLIILVLGLVNIGGYRWYKHTKVTAVNDQSYNKAFITSKKKIAKEFKFMKERIADVFKYKNKENILENTVYLVLFSLIIVLLIKHKEVQSVNHSKIQLALVFTCVIASVALFFSSWNYRSEFSPRYYTPVYIMLSTALLTWTDRIKSRGIKIFLCVVVSFHCYMFTYYTLIKPGYDRPYKQYADFKTLRKGTLIADYWESHLLQAIAIDSLQSLSYDNQLIRNYTWKEIPLSENRFYFINNQNAREHGLRDTIKQHNTLFAFTGKLFQLKTAEVMEYKKLE
jgi:hypothetical protein